MPNSNDNQDLEKDKEQGKETQGSKEQQQGNSDENKLTSDNLKGKKVDADPTKESDKPADV